MTEQEIETQLLQHIKSLEAIGHNLECRIQMMSSQLHQYGGKASVDYSPRSYHELIAERAELEKLHMHNKAELDDARVQIWKNAAASSVNETSSELPFDDTPPVSATIELPPGATLSKVAELLLSPRKYERDVESVLADWHSEYFEALDQKREPIKMASIRIRNTWAFLKATGCLALLEAAGELVAKLVKLGGAGS